MTRPMTDSEIYDLIDAVNLALTDAVERIEALEKRVADLKDRLHDHEQAIPHPAVTP